jgi:hypothetical protein
MARHEESSSSASAEEPVLSRKDYRAVHRLVKKVHDGICDAEPEDLKLFTQTLLEHLNRKLCRALGLDTAAIANAATSAADGDEDDLDG